MRPPPAGSAQIVRTSGRQLRTTCNSKRGGIWVQFGGGGGGGGPVSAGAGGAKVVFAFGGAAVCFFAGCWVEAGGADAVAGLGAAAGFAGAGFSSAGAAAAGVAAAGAAAGFSAAEMAFTALWQAADSLLSLRLRHWKASAPPGVTLAQFDMKSDRQDERIALRCASVTCACASVAKPKMVTASAAAPPKKREICLGSIMKCFLTAAGQS
jgi:hypothetical protein